MEYHSRFVEYIQKSNGFYSFYRNYQFAVLPVFDYSLSRGKLRFPFILMRKKDLL